ncbi:MAG: response regulator transcription factor [Pseudomonadota bacterium]
MTRILLADDHDLVRETLSAYMRREGGFDVVQTRTLMEALRVHASLGPFRLIVLDFRMPGMNGLEGLERMKAVADCPIAIMSGTAPADVARRVLRAGASGFLPKTLTPQGLVSGVNLMLGGEIFCPAEVNTDDDTVHLTPRERDVLQGVAEGKLNKEIARDFDIQEVTVKLHVKTLSRKLGAKNRTHAAMLGRDLGLV